MAKRNSHQPTPPTAPVRCAIYTRKSTARGMEQEFSSVVYQREACSQYIAARAHAQWQCLPTTYDDGGYTGANLDRPAFQKLMSAVDAGEIDVVVVYKLDRLSRSLLDFAQVMDRLHARGAALVSVTQNFDTSTAMGRLVLNMLMSFAEFERDMIAERTRDKMAAARRKGKWCGGPPPFGYNVQDSKLIVDPAEAEQVRAIYRLYLDCASLSDTAYILNERGWRTKRWISRNGRHIGGGQWDKKSVHRTLTSVTYLGKVEYDGEIYEGVHEGIVDTALYDRVRRLLTRTDPDGHRLRRYKNPEFILRGLLKCTACGALMSPRWSTSRKRKYRYYVCLPVQSRGARACPVRSVPANAIEEYVVRHIRAIAAQPALVSEVVEALAAQRRDEVPVLQQEQAQLQADLAQCRTEAKRLMQAIGGSADAGSMAASRLAELETQAQQLTRRIATLNADIAALTDDQIDIGQVARALDLFDPVWDVLHNRERGRVLQLLLSKIVYDAGSGIVELRFHPLGISQLAAEAETVTRSATDNENTEAA